MTRASSGSAGGQDIPAPRRDRSELALHALLFAAIAVVCQAVLLHPTETLYSPVSDLLSGHHPYRMLQRQALASWGRITLWDHTAFGGVPLISDPQSGIFYPPNWLQLLDPVGEGEAGYGFLLVLHLLVGAFGMLFWLRGHGYDRPARFAGAIVFVLCGKCFFHVLGKGHIVFLPLMWLPWQCALIDRIWLRPTARRVALLALAVAMMVLGTHSQLLLYGLVICAAYALFSASAAWRGSRRPGRPGTARALLALSAAALLAGGLVAVFMLPILDGMNEFVRGGGFSYAEAVQRSLSLRELIGFLLPVAIPPERAPSLFAGSLATVLALFAAFDRARRADVVFHGSVVLLLVWHALGDGADLYHLLFASVPGFDLFRFPHRSLLMLGLPLGVLAASGQSALCLGEPSRGRRWLAAACLVGGVLLFAAYRSTDAAIAAIALGVPAACALARRRFAVPALAWGVALLVFADQARFAMPLIETRPLARILGENPVVEMLQAPIGEGRVLAFDSRRAGDMSSLPIAYATRAAIETLRGFSPLIPEATALYLYTGAAQGELRSKHATTIETFEIASRPHLDLFNVRWIVSNQPLEIDGLVLRARFDDLRLHHFQSRFDHDLMPETYVYENTHCFPRAALVRAARPVASREQAIREIGGFDPTELVLLEGVASGASFEGGFRPLPLEHRGQEIELELEAGAGGYLVLSELWYRGWHAEIDGAASRILRANGVFRALQLGPGPHRVHLWYRPRAYALGLWISGVSLLVSLSLLWPRRAAPNAAA